MNDETTISPQPELSFAGPPAGPARSRNGLVAVVIGVCVVAVLGVLAAGALVIHGRSSSPAVLASATGTAPTSVAGTDGTALPGSADQASSIVPDAVPADNAVPAGQTGGQSAGQNGGAPAPAPAPKGPAAPAGPSPTITSFKTPENIDCHNGNFQMFSASWTTTNAVKTTISIDGPGVYKTYGPNASESLPFNCSSPHTFLLTATGANGKTATKSITLQPRNVQKPPTPDTDETPTPKGPVATVPQGPKLPKA